jgi:hypothetical protein
MGQDVGNPLFQTARFSVHWLKMLVKMKLRMKLPAKEVPQ